MKTNHIIWAVAGLSLSTVCADSRINERDGRMSVNYTAENDIQNDWIVVNDDVMGGISKGKMSRLSNGNNLFSGNLSLENNGGFSSVRQDAAKYDFSSSAGVGIRVKGDGKIYQFRVETSVGNEEITYKADFETTSGFWMDIHIPWENFTATYRGRLLKDKPPVNTEEIKRLGFLISTGRKGQFRLEIEKISPFNDA